MKKFLAILVAMLMVLSLGTALADAQDELVHDGTLPATSEQEVKITINALTDGDGPDPDNRLPSEYHVRVKWDVADGVYNATASDSDDDNGFKNYSWDCETLDFIVNSYTPGTGETDIREGNWASKPAVSFEVTNASTPDLEITATPSLKGTDAWAQFISGTSIATQNTTIGTQVVAPVLKANLGTGVKSYEQNLGAASHNVYAYTYTLEWNYDALNTAALNAYKAGTGTQDYSNTFVVTIGVND